MRLFILTLCYSVCACTSFALYESKLARIDASGTLKLSYDSRVFGMPSNELKAVQDGSAPGINPNRIESEDDFIITFSPAVHFKSKLGLFQISGSAGVQISQYLLNGDMSNIVPTTSLSIDFDDTLALKKRISNNAKIRKVSEVLIDAMAIAMCPKVQMAAKEQEGRVAEWKDQYGNIVNKTGTDSSMNICVNM